MSMKDFVPQNVSLPYLNKIKCIFIVNKSLAGLTKKVNDRKVWRMNRRSNQQNLLQLINKRPAILYLIYKLQDFVVKDRKSFRLKCYCGPGDPRVLVWEHHHREDKLLDFRKTRKRQRVTDRELKKMLRLFFLAMPELFIKDQKNDGTDFYVKPRELYDNMYFLASKQAELDDLYAGLKTKNPIFLKAWLELLS